MSLSIVVNWTYSHWTQYLVDLYYTFVYVWIHDICRGKKRHSTKTQKICKQRLVGIVTGMLQKLNGISIKICGIQKTAEKNLIEENGQIVVVVTNLAVLKGYVLCLLLLGSGNDVLYIYDFIFSLGG